MLEEGGEVQPILITHVNVDKHYQSVRKLIDDYYKSTRQVKDPMVVLFLSN